MDAAGRLGRRDTLHAMAAALPLEDGVRAVPLDRERDLLVSAAVVRARLELLDLEAAALRVAREHAVEVGGPERRLVAALALADLEDHVLPVGRVARGERGPELLLEPRRALLELGDELAQVGVVARSLEVLAGRAPLLRELVRALELLELPAHLRSLAVVVVDRRVGHAVLRFLEGALEVVDEAVERRGHAAVQRSRASSVISGTEASAFETGQFAFAPSAASAEARPHRDRERLPSTVSAIFVIPSPGWNVTVAEVFSSSGGVPAFARPAESAIEKHAACAAAISSSGLVLPPVASSERAAQLTGSSPNAPLVVELIVPLPSIKPPFHVTSARRSVAMSSP